MLGEIGIPYDMDGKSAYEDGDYRSQIRAMDANLFALEENLLNFTLWNYCPDNNNAWGDQWNGEDLSLYSRPENPSPNDLNHGGRAVAAFCRPYPILTAGTPKSLSFDLSQVLFNYTFTRTTNDIHNSITEIYLPAFHYPNINDVEIWVSGGTFQLYLDEQRLVWDCQGSNSPDRNRSTSPTDTASNASDTPLISAEAALFLAPLNQFTTHRIIIGLKRSDGRSIVEVLKQQEERHGMCPTGCQIL